MSYTLSHHTQSFSQQEFTSSLDSIYIYLVVEGTVLLQSDQESETYRAGEIIITNSQSTLYFELNHASVAVLIVNAYTYNRFTFINSDLQNTQLEEAKDCIKDAFITLVKNIVNHESFEAEIQLIRLINWIHNTELDVYTHATQKKLPETVQQVIDYINSHYKSQLSLKQIAQDFYVNQSYLSRKFSESMDITLIKYIKKIKIQHICRNLFQGYKITDIWKAYHFPSYSSFLKAFTEIIGTTPEAFLQAHHEEQTSTPVVSATLLEKVKKLEE